MEKFLISIFLFYILYRNALSASVPKSNTESFIIHYLEDRRIIPVKVELNAKQQTEHIISIGGETLYDFNHGKVAYKDLNSSQCFIADIVEESLKRDRRKLKELQKGVVRGFYLPTFTIQEEFTNETDLSEKLGNRITEFCSGNIVSSVARHQRRRKRDTPGEQGQFTHHSYGHYGHQSNNYAHYGQESHITGTVDRHGNIRNQRVNQHQVRSESSQLYPSQGPTAQQVSVAGSRNGVSPQFQTQPHIPTHQQSWTSRIPHGTGSAGQFSFQATQENGYQLNLPLGLKAGNTYRSGIQSGGQYNAGGSQPQMTTEYKKYPASQPSGIYQPPTDQSGFRLISPQIPSIPENPYVPHTLSQSGVYPVDNTKTSDGRLGAAVGIPGYHDQTRITQPHGIGVGQQTQMVGQSTDYHRQLPERIPYTQTSETDSRSLITGTGRQAGADFELPGRIHGDRTTVPGAQFIPSITDQRGIQSASLQPTVDQSFVNGEQMIPSIILQPRTQTTAFHPGSVPGYQTPSFQPMKFPSAYMPGNAIQSHTGLPGQIPTGRVDPSTTTVGTHFPTAISRPAHQIPSIHSGLVHQQPYVPGDPITSQHLQTSGNRYPTGSETDSNIGAGSRIPILYPPITSSHLTPALSGTQGLSLIPSPGLATSIPGETGSAQQRTLPRSHGAIQNGVSYPPRYYPQIPTRTGLGHIVGGSPSGSIPRQITEFTPNNGRSVPLAGGQQSDTNYLQRGTNLVSQDNVGGYQVPSRLGQGEVARGPYLYPPPSTQMFSEMTAPGDRIVSPSQIAPEISGVYAQDSASSQTQIQTNNASTAAKASAAGQHRGLGSQTQVQGGYTGNGSFSALAQSGFTGGVVQSQVQGEKQGGLSGSNVQVERVGAAQSQVQIGQPSGSASSSAQGRFSGGTTQVQAQSSKTSGSAGAQAQSTGLSSSHVQVNIAGKEVSDQDRFQGTVSASVHGGHYSGQSQTQLQGGYNSGRTYVATAQGGFDSSLGFQGSVPPSGSLPSHRNQHFKMGQPISDTSRQSPQSITTGRVLPSGDSLSEPGFINGGRIPQTFRTGVPDQPASIRNGIQPPLHSHLSSTSADRRHPTSSGIQPQMTSSGINPEQNLIPSMQHIQTGATTPGFSHPPRMYQESRSRDNGEQHPVSIPEPQRPTYLHPSSQFPVGPPASTYQTDLSGIPKRVVAERPVLGSQGLPSYNYDQNAPLLPVIPSGIQPNGIYPAAPSISGQRGDYQGRIQPSTFLPGGITPGYLPGVNVGSSYLPGFLPTSQQPIHQQYNHSAAASIGHPSLLQQPSNAQYTPSYLPSHIPSLQPDQVPIFTRPDQVQHTGLQHGLHYSPSFIPGQPQISPPRPGVFPSQERPDQSLFITKPDGSLYTESRHATSQQPSILGQPHISPPKPQVTLPSETIPSTGFPSSLAGIDKTQAGVPGVSEPDTQNCCNALRDLKRRCCALGKQNGATESSCCKSKSKDFDFDFSTEDDLDENNGNGPCKVVKAICYIVYKPVGKARVCKPTATIGC